MITSGSRRTQEHAAGQRIHQGWGFTPNCCEVLQSRFYIQSSHLCRRFRFVRGMRFTRCQNFAADATVAATQRLPRPTASSTLEPHTLPVDLHIVSWTTGQHSAVLCGGEPQQ